MYSLIDTLDLAADDIQCSVAYILFSQSVGYSGSWNTTLWKTKSVDVRVGATLKTGGVYLDHVFPEFFLQAQDWRAAGATGQLYGPRGRCSILPSDALHVCRVDRALDMYRGQLLRPFLSYVLTEHRR